MRHNLHFLTKVPRRSKAIPCVGIHLHVTSWDHLWPLQTGDPQHNLGNLKAYLGFSFLNSFFSTKLVASCQITHFPPVLGIQQMKANVSVEIDSRFLSKLIRYLYYFFTVDSTGSFAPCHCCMTFHLAQGLFLARDYQKYFSVGLSLLLNKESYYCKNFAETKKIYWTNGKL